MGVMVSREELYEQYLRVLLERDTAIQLLAEAYEWILRPVETQDDAAYFIMWEEKVKEILYGNRSIE